MNEGIWKYSDRFTPYIEPQFRHTLGEGGTPIERIDLDNGVNVYLKREDLNPSGSHKDRGLAFQISVHIQDGKSDFVISSSGNSSISAIKLLYKKNETLNIFLSSNISQDKLKRLSQIIGKDISTNENQTFHNITIHFSRKPTSEAFKFAKQNNAVLLRGSTDRYGTAGYQTLAYEISEELTDVDAIFLPVSSGTTAVGIYEGFKTVDTKLPQLHIVQTEKVHPIAREFDSRFSQSDHSIADSIVDRVAHRKSEVSAIIKESGGSGWVISDKEILEAYNFLQSKDINVSFDAALPIAAIYRHSNANKVGDMKILAILTGRK